MKEIAEQVVEVSMRRLGKIPGLIGGHIFTLEADRLTKPAEDSSPEAKFEGVKYVCCAFWDGRPAEVISQDEYVANCRGRLGTKVPGSVFVKAADGERVQAVARDLTPWHPKKGDRVRLEAKSENAGTVDRISCFAHVAHAYAVVWDDNTAWGTWCELSELRPYSFPPEHTKPEAESEGGKAEFEEGELGIGCANNIAVYRDGEWRGIDGPYLVGACTPASDAELLRSVRSNCWAGKAAVHILRDHFRREAQKENQDD